jgi:hypothetical protein
VNVLALNGSVVYAGGLFNRVGGQVRDNIAAVDAAGGAPTAWDSDANDRVYALVVSGGTVYAGGFFTRVGGQPRTGIAALDAGTGLATNWDPSADNTVYALALDGELLYAGGYFTQIDGAPRARLAALNVATGAADAWDPGADVYVYSLGLSGDVVFAGGAFQSAGRWPQSGIAQIGASTTGVSPSPDGVVVELAPNEPNPFTRSTLIRYSLPAAQKVALRIYDLAGRVVATLLAGESQSAGEHVATFTARGLSGGIYFCGLQVDGIQRTRKMLYVK